MRRDLRAILTALDGLAVAGTTGFRLATAPPDSRLKRLYQPLVATLVPLTRLAPNPPDVMVKPVRTMRERLAEIGWTSQMILLLPAMPFLLYSSAEERRHTEEHFQDQRRRYGRAWRQLNGRRGLRRMTALRHLIRVKDTRTAAIEAPVVIAPALANGLGWALATWRDLSRARASNWSYLQLARHVLYEPLYILGIWPQAGWVPRRLRVTMRIMSLTGLTLFGPLIFGFVAARLYRALLPIREQEKRIAHMEKTRRRVMEAKGRA
ncbi:MAG: hypothetical protein ACR2JC_10200 [Chloroflexota bacterium]|nr:MAG: hypothetical protein DLM70_18160 [Chloroflexota bacterium]